MFNPQSSIFQRRLPIQIFEQLDQLWQEMADIAGEQAWLIGEELIIEDKLQQLDRFRLLLSPLINALIIAKPTEDKSFYQVSLTFDRQLITKFIIQLREQIPEDNYLVSWLDNLKQENQDQTSAIYQTFTLKLLEILVYFPDILSKEEPINSHSLKPQTINKIFRDRLEQERILNQVSLQISQNLELDSIINITLEQVLHLLKLDRLVIYQLNAQVITKNKSHQNIDIISYEAKSSAKIQSILHFQDEHCFRKRNKCSHKYSQGFSLIIDDIVNSKLDPCLKSLMTNFQVQAKIITPILVRHKLWGFLIAHQCFSPRHWKRQETKFLLNVAQYLSIAIYQNQSYQQLQQQKQNLQIQINKRAQDVRDALLAAQAASQSKSEFIGNISHELRTPLTCIIGLSSTLLHWSANQADQQSLSLEKQYKYLNIIQESGKKLLTLINNILEISELEAGQSVLNISDFSLSNLARLTMQVLEEEAQQKGIHFHLDCQVKKNRDIFSADQQRLQQILLNLISNAIKFTPANGQVILRIWREQKEVIFQVEDTGIGIPKNQLSLLFETFQHLENYRQKSYEGAGLGLALTKQLVELHRGRIEVDSVVTQGSIFTVWIPQQAKTIKQIYEHKGTEQIIEHEHRTIMLASQDEDNATLICKLLTAADYQVVWFCDAQDVVKNIRLLEPKIVILDQDLPELENLITNNLARIKLNMVKFKSKFLLISDWGKPVTRGSNHLDSGTWQRLSEQGIDSYLPKPIDPNQLLDTITNLMY